MGTNYYFQEKSPCKCCGRAFETVHIGKSSAGWCFALHVYPEDGIHDLPDWWEKWCAGGFITDEYGASLSANEMMAAIQARFGKRNAPLSDEWCRQNQGILGPFGLARHRVDGRHCIGHGVGTYDLLIGGDTSW